jgi:hypothetical protein
MKRALILSLAVATATAGATARSAHAKEPTRETVAVHTVANPWAQCPGFPVIGEFDIELQVTTFYDEGGALSKRIVHATIQGAVTNATTGYSLPTGGVRVFHYDFAAGIVVTTGTNNFTKLPDGGVANGGAGRFVVDASGRLLEHNGPDADERVQLCAALGGGS